MGRSINTTKLLDGVTGTGAGTALALEKSETGYLFPIQVTGISSATVKIQASFDNSTWDDVDGGTFTADICTTMNVAFPYVRANCTTYSSGTITVWIGQ